MADGIDKIMVQKGLVQTRSQASMLIAQGDVYCNGQVVKKAGLKVSQKDQIEIKQGQLYVSRGAYKLLKAINEFHLDFKDKNIADIGASTGGFTQVALEKGASKVYAIDVGHDQLSPLLIQDDRVVNLEGLNAKYPIEIDEKVDFVVMDISFISITKVLRNALQILKNNGFIVCLVKPQFEAGKARMGKNGLISEKNREEIVVEVDDWLADNGFDIIKKAQSPIVGNKSGNIEYLYLLKGSAC